MSKLYFLIIALLAFVSLGANGQSYLHGSGKFVKNGSHWTEFLNGQEHSHYEEYSADANYYYVSNEYCSVAVPKQVGYNFLLNQGAQWVPIYSTCVVIDYSQPSQGTATMGNYGGGSASAAQYQPTEHHERCGVCDGKGTCWNCHGSGVSVHASGIRANCGACNGTGKCTSCNGLGHKTVVY